MSNAHSIRYKNEGIDSKELRRRREVEGVQLSKQKREIQQFKRRNINGTIQKDNNDETDPHTLSDWSNIKEEIIKHVFSNNEEDQLNATKKIRKLVSSIPNSPIDAIISSGIIPQLVAFLQNTTNYHLQFEAAWALTNIASGTSEQTQQILEADAAPVFIWLLESPNKDIQEQAVWALGNLAGDSTLSRDYILSLGIMEPLLKIMNHQLNLSLTRNCVWTISNLCRGKNSLSNTTFLASAIPVLFKLLTTHSDADILADTCWAFSYLCDGPNVKIDSVINAGVCPVLVKLLMHTQFKVVTAALRAVGNIVTGNDEQTQVVLNCSVLPCLFRLLESPKDNIRREACWTISNITAGNQNQIQAVLNENIFPAILNIMATADFKTRKEATWAIRNATAGGTSEQIQYLVDQECIVVLCDLLTVTDLNIIQVALEGLENILMLGETIAKKTGASNQYAVKIEECYGLDKIEVLQSHENNQVYRKAFEMIERYFSSIEDDPSVASSSQTEYDLEQFNFGDQNIPMTKFEF